MPSIVLVQGAPEAGFLVGEVTRDADYSVSELGFRSMQFFGFGFVFFFLLDCGIRRSSGRELNLRGLGRSSVVRDRLLQLLAGLICAGLWVLHFVGRDLSSHLCDWCVVLIPLLHCLSEVFSLKVERLWFERASGEFDRDSVTGEMFWKPFPCLRGHGLDGQSAVNQEC